MKRSLFACLLFTLGVTVGGFSQKLLLEVWAFPDSCLPGDINGDANLDVSDPIALLQHLFVGGPEPAKCNVTCPASKQVILVRHAERDPGGDAPLNEEGRARAQALATMLRNAKIDGLFPSDYIRTQQTLEPLALAKNIDMEVIPTQEPSNTEVAQMIVDKVKSLPPGSRSVFAQHSFTVHHILDAFNVPKSQREGLSVSGSNYDNLLVIQVPATGEPNLLWMSYGEVNN